MAVVFGDAIAMRAESMQADFANPFNVMRLMVTHAAASELRAMARRGALDGEAVVRVLAVSGHRRRARPVLTGGLTARECEVLRLVALGLSTRRIAEQLGISAKTADHHIQHAYTKIGVFTRGAAALYAIEHGVMTTDA
jgi:DNA-binding CsgD family transcriptional regulator